jgi:FkbM family methyltransferase
LPEAELKIYPVLIKPGTLEFCEEFIKESCREKYVFGCNEVAKKISEKVNIDGFIDDFTTNNTFCNKPILKVKQVPHNSMVITSTSLRPVSVRNILNDRNIDNIDYFQFYKYSGMIEKDEYLSGCIKDIQKNEDKYRQLFRNLKDEKSKNTLEKIVNFRLSGDINYMEFFKYDIVNQYFEDFLNLKEGEIFADIGGFDGATSLEFMKRCSKYKAIHFFEPEPENMKKSMHELNKYRDIYFYNSGLSNSNEKLRLSTGLGSASRIDDKGDTEISVRRLDDLVKEYISFMKMDIEGGEIPALEGAAEHIKYDLPKMAISCYHKPDDFWKIPEFVLSINNRFDLYLRHYTEGIHETVMFFIPK